VVLFAMAKNDPPSAEIIRRGFGTRLRGLRKARGWEPKQTSARLDILYHRYMKYEEGLREPPFWLLVRMARLYGVTTDFLLIGADGESQEIPISKLES
jgi:transcriptional regulator with XRE-family HTH domain